MADLRKNENYAKPPERGASQWAVAWRRFKKHKSGLFGLGMIIALVMTAILHNLIAPYPQGSFRPLYEGESGMPPSWKHPFGTTVSGIDVFSEIIHGSVYTLYVAGCVTLITMLLTVAAGIVAGYLGTYVDEIIMRITEVFLVFPSTLLILVFARLFQLRVSEPFWNIGGLHIPVGLTIIIAIISMFGWPGNARIIRGEVIRIRESEYIQAARSLGASSRWIMLRHVFPNVLPQVIVLATLTMATAVLVEAGISFLGFGDPNIITWGSLLEGNFNFLSTTWWAEVFPGLAVFFTILGFNLLGDALSDAMNPRLRE